MNEDADTMSQDQKEAKASALEQVAQLQERVTWLTRKLYGEQGDTKSEEESVSGELKAIKGDLGKLKKTIEGWQGSFNKGLTTAVTTVIVAIITFIVTKVTGG